MSIDLNTASAILTTDASPRGTTADDALRTLLIRTVDAQAGYDTMVAKAEPEFLPVALQFRDLHARHGMTLAPMLAARDAQHATSPSVMGKINKAVVSFRALFDEIDADVMDRIRSGEAYVREALEIAVASGLTGTELRDVMQMRDDLDRLLADTSHLG